jgi:choline-sulfatase/uncharacterized sulfatase
MSKERPNVLFLFSDEHNAKCLGHAERSQVSTPALDRLAAEGVRFTHAVAQNPICTPSRISFASGQYCHNHGYYGLAGQPETPDLLQHVPHVYGHFKAADYRVGVLGKSHLPPGWVEASCDCFVQHKDPDHGYPAFLCRNGIPVEQSGALSWTRKIQADGVRRFSNDFGPDELPHEYSMERWQALQAIDFLKTSADDEAPFFLQVGFQRPHTPCVPSPEFWEMYPEESLREPPSAEVDLSGKSPAMRRKRRQLETLPPEHFVSAPRTYPAMRRRYQRAYFGCITQMDRAIGEILDALERTGLADNTIVVYSTDHGDFAGEHGLTEKAPGIGADAVCRIPFLWRWPNHLPAGHCCDQLVESVDLAPTLCALAGLPSMPTADGQDLSQLLQGGAAAVREIAVTENPWSRSVTDNRYRLVLYPKALYGGQPTGELYDLQNDPWEMSNLYDDPAYAGVVNRLRHQLLDHLITTTRIGSAHPPLDPGGAPYGKGTEAKRHHVDADGKRGASYLQAIATCTTNYL